MILKYILVFILFIHGMLHFLGFAKAFKFGKITTITNDISKPLGLPWLLTGYLFLAAAILFWLNAYSWMIFGFLAVIISQFLIILIWTDAKYGTIPNVIILVAIAFNFASYHFERNFHLDVKQNLEQTKKY